MTEWAELDDPRNGGCRPCCTTPHGLVSVGAAIAASLAFIFGMVAVNSCNFLKPNYPGFLYCHPPPEPSSPYGSCGDCHCINGEEPCPSDPGKIPLTEADDDWLRQLKAMDAINPYQMVCNPYNTTGAIQTGTCTDPPQIEYQLELWETAVCGISYDMDTLDENQCPTLYEMQTYDSEQEMLDAGAQMTHWGACGACSTTKDLAVYLEHPDLTGKGQECSVRAIANGFEEGVSCFQEVGYTESCAVMWMHNVFQTRDNCFDICFQFTFLGDGANNGPAPSCKLAECLDCDEKMAGPGFQTVAARSRRRSGLLSKIVRDCNNLLIVNHTRPCDMVKVKLGQQRGLQGEKSSERLQTPEKYRPPEPSETCLYVSESLGLGGYSAKESGFSLLSLAFGGEQYDSAYSTCYRYDFKRVLSGFWKNQKEIFGRSYSAALAFGIIGAFVGGVTTIFTWCSMCVAFHATAWRRMSMIYLICSLCMFLTMIFFSSGVCEDGCTIEKAGVFAILSGFAWIIAAGFAIKSKPMDTSIPKSSCCCCPRPIERSHGAYTAVSVEEEEATTIIVTESEDTDGSNIVTKTTCHPDGSKTTERTIYKKAEEVQAEHAKLGCEEVADE